MKNIYEYLLEKADAMKIIDTHEHLNPHKNYVGDVPDILCEYFSHYSSTDLMSAGMSEAELDTVRDYQKDIVERFKILSPYLDCIRNTSYYRALKIAASKLHKVPDITIDTIEELNEKFKKAVSDDNYRRYVMKEVCNIEVSVNDAWIGDIKQATTELFAAAWHPDPYMTPGMKPEAASLDEYCEVYKQHFLKQIKDGMKTLKSTAAYWRSLYYEDVDYKTASELYNNYIKNLKDDDENVAPFPKPLQDYMMHYILKTADENNFVIQIHTGLQEGMRNNLENSNPMLLKNLFGKYQNLTFDLFHLGYPYERELMVLAKINPNVYIDMCWTHIISPYAARNAFNEMLDVLPYTKIFGFGGDYIFYDGVVGHLTIAKQDICEVLADKVNREEIDTELAEKILSAVLHDNAKKIFKL